MSFAGPSGQIFFSKSTQKRRSHAAGALQAWAGWPSSPPWILISWFLHVNFCRPISAVPAQPQRRPGAALDLRAAPQGHPWASDLFLRCLFSTGVNGFPPLFLEREAAGCLPARTALIRGMASSACSARPLYHWRGPPFSWSPPAASVTKADAAMGIGEGEGRGGTLRRHACRSKRSAAA